MKRICTVCARGGSQGLPKKNIRPLLGKPLIQHTLEQAKASGLFDVIVVSSDDEEALKIAEQSSVHALRRPDYLATHESGKLVAIVHAVENMEAAQNTVFDQVVDLDVTSPLRSIDDIKGAVVLFEKSGATNVITGAPAHRSPYFNLVERASDGAVKLCKPLPEGVLRRQDSPACFDMNASIYVWKRDALRENARVFYDDTALFEMPRERSFDIDDALDFAMVEMIMKARES